jgi:hypothetical protein
MLSKQASMRGKAATHVDQAASFVGLKKALSALLLLCLARRASRRYASDIHLPANNCSDYEFLAAI